MHLHIAQLPKLLKERRSTAIFGVVIITMLWCGISLKYYEDYRGDLKDAERSGSNFAMAFEENVLRSLGEIDKALLYLRRTIENRQETTDFHTIVSTTDVLSEIIVQVAIIDRDGVMRASNAGPQPAPTMDLSDREHFRVHLDSKEDMLFISKPLVGRASGKWSVQVTRRFLDSDGNFAGVVVASLNPAHFTNFYNNLDFGSSASIALIGADGIVRSSGGSEGGFALGQDLKNTGTMRYMSDGGKASFVRTDPANGEDSLVNFRKVRGYPLWVTVSNKLQDIYQSSWYDLQVNFLAGLLLTLIIIAAMEQILRTEAKARQKADQLKLTLENMSQGIMLVTRDLEIPIINSRCAELLDLPKEFIKSPPRFDELVRYQAQHSSEEKGGAPGAKSSEVRRIADESSGRLTISERLMPDGSVLEVRSGHLPDGSFIQTFTDITKRREAEAYVARLASEDPLTGLANRRVFRSTLESICARRQDDRPAQVAVLFIDLDRFKTINDTLGHRVGDLLLQEVAKRLRQCVSSEYMLARLGGDEFAIIVPNVDSLETVEVLAGRVIASISTPFSVDGYQMPAAMSIGIAIGPQDGAGADELLVAADLALYAVKAEGRGNYKFYHKSMNADLNERRQLELDLRAALDRNELELYYQPLIDLRTNTVTGFEALARWRHSERGFVPPAKFIPVAEDSGLIVAIGEWALNEACRQAVSWPEHLKISVNLSPVQFLAPNLTDKIRQTLSKFDLAPQRLVLEITERILMDNSAEILQKLGKLKSLGVRIALDDFGTGFSSLSYLRSFPFDKIKIDRAFVSDLDTGSSHAVIVQAVVSIARALGMTTTAEGVETEEQRVLLAALGYDQAQGYLFGEAVPADKVPGVIQTFAPKGTSKNRVAA
jgi:diguanylate cyclase (GGDEF)-like protein